jgi:hypothetical protein
MRDRVVVRRLQADEDAEEAFCCMSEVPTPWPKALSACRAWVSKNLGQHVDGYHLEAADGEVIGQLYYAPSERALIAYELEPDVAVMYCEWIQRRHQKRGLAQHLFGVFEAEMRREGLKGILVEATTQEQQMHFRHYLTRGFEIIHDADSRKLLYLPLNQPEITFRPMAPRIEPRQGVPVEILILSGYLCPFEASTQIMLTEIAREFGDRVVLNREPLTPDTLLRYGVVDGIFINGRRKLTGGVTEEAIRQAIIEEF